MRLMLCKFSHQQKCKENKKLADYFKCCIELVVLSKILKLETKGCILMLYRLCKGIWLGTTQGPVWTSKKINLGKMLD